MSAVGKDEMTNNSIDLHWPIYRQDHVIGEVKYSWPRNLRCKFLITLTIYIYNPSDQITRSHLVFLWA